MKVCSTCQQCYDDIVSSCTESEHPELSEAREGNTQIIAGYRLETVLESGIKGETYRARRTDADQSCLIRILSGTEETKNQFLQDAKTAATIFNESIVDVYEAGSLESGEVFVVAEEPGGQTARELLNNVGVPQLLTTVQVVRQAAEAVHALHLTGLIHRAIRPENIILTTDAEHRLLVRIQNVDLGGVIEHAIVSNKFLIDSAIDSLRYFAPDQFSGESASVKTDVYSLGIVLYEMLSGAPPFDAEKGSGLIDMHRNQRPAEVSIDNFDLRMLLTHTLMESLQKQPAKRQSSANAFARQLRHIEQLALHSPTPPAAGIGSSAPPPIAMVAAAPASAAAQPARIVEIPKTTQVVKVGAAKVESQPMPTKVAAEPIQELRIEPCPSVPVVHEIEVMADEGLNGLSEQLPDIPDMLGTRAIVKSEKVETDPPKSRLKRLKKQLRTFTSPLVIAPAGNDILNSEIVEAQSEVTSVGHEQVVDHAVPIAPRKIIWKQPEDDIPSMDEAMEVLSQGDLSTVASASESTASEPASKTPRKIKWVQPEDDISSMEEACEVLATEQVAEEPIVSAPFESAVPEPVSIAPEKIEWVQPEDDIPSIDDVREILAT
ncbi:MAG TPA: serine/threonine-protein kinase, partial [Pyrinomonadaceae bacterium]|nr:serine/threonine-protein kinase [Pyrinomonadaceae bacterium]